MEIISNIPGGNVLVKEVRGNHVTISPDLRDTEGYWFYWYFSVRNAAGKELTFHLSHENMVSELGPAVSLDKGWSWCWLGDDAVEDLSFSYQVPVSADEVRFSMGMPYTLDNLRSFLSRYRHKPAFRVEELTHSRKGRPVYSIRAGDLSGDPHYRIMFTARHHCCEMMASYVLEGILKTIVGPGPLGRWFCENVEVLSVPFVDTDGVEDGDQGKNRIPHDHNRDYGGESIHVETAAIRDFVRGWSDGRMRVTVDLHCPYIRGGSYNSMIYMVGSPDPEIWGRQKVLGKLLEDVAEGPLPYRCDDNLPFGTAWNTGDNIKKGQCSFSRWAAAFPSVKLATSFEIPYSAAHGTEVNPYSARLFGRDIVRALRCYLGGN